jgi:hypothetical protein
MLMFTYYMTHTRSFWSGVVIYQNVGCAYWTRQQTTIVWGSKIADSKLNPSPESVNTISCLFLPDQQIQSAHRTQLNTWSCLPWQIGRVLYWTWYPLASPNIRSSATGRTDCLSKTICWHDHEKVVHLNILLCPQVNWVSRINVPYVIFPMWPSSGVT